MKILVIDSKNVRREALVKLFRSLNQILEVKELENVWGEGGPPQTIAELEDQAARAAATGDILLLHAGDDQREAERALSCYSRAAKHVICYSAGYVTDRIRRVASADRDRRICVLEQRVPVTATVELDWDLKGYLDAIKRTLPNACEILNKFDPEREARLDLLYHLLEKSPSIQAVKEWNPSQIPGLSDEDREALREEATKFLGSLKEEPSDALRKLRDVLLGV